MTAKKVYFISIAAALAVGGAAAAVTGGSMELFGQLQKPPLAPPGWLFPIVWTILFVLMGVGAARVWLKDAPGKKHALRLYGLQLAVNFLWTIIFFNIRAYFSAFLCLLILLLLIVLMLRQFAKVDKTAAWLQLPYLLWVCFAGYLNFGIYLLNL